MMSRALLAALLLATVSTGCDRSSAAQPPSVRSAADAPRPVEGTYVDSALPIPEMLRRFQDGLSRVDTLAHASASPEALVQRLISAIDARDTTAVRQMLLSREEFGWLYYPTSATAFPPYELSPQLTWFQLVMESDKGMRRALDRLGGTGIRYAAHRCSTGPTLEGVNRTWSRCAVTFHTVRGDTVSAILFGGLVERGGRYKFVNYWNKM